MGGDESLPRGVGVGAGSVTLSDDRAGESPGPRRDDLAAAFKAVDGDSDELAREHARARLSEQLFGVALEPVKRGRFVIIEQLGQGGMGVVYSAYDPQLDRRVALKVLRADAGTRNDGDRARDRLLREAQALARLSHPHVVPIHDVGVISSDDEVDSGRHGGDQVYLVMEFVVGRTLRDWASDDERSWREVLAVYEQAGRGLAAAHAAGLVHRDFKPDNALIGEDGRVRVLDFGLARGRHELEDSSDDRDAESAAAATRDALSLESTMDMNALSDGESDTGRAVGPDTLMPPAEAGGGRLGERMTATGAILGTPAYMAPEQLLGHKVGPAGDQYSFCVAIYEALYGQRPHAGATLAAITAHRVSGRLREPPPRSAVPGWIFSVLRRGLARQPDERYPSMDELLSALGRDPARVRRRWLIGLAAAVVVAGSLTVAGLAVTRARSAVAPCTGGAEMMAELWGDSRREELGRVILHSGHPYAGRAWPRIAAGIDRYASRWVTDHREACLAHLRGEQSAELLDRRMSCLDQRRQALAGALAALGETERDAVAGAVVMVEKLPDLGFCGDIEALSAEVAPPEDVRVRSRVREVRSELSQARAVVDAGRYAAARQVISAAVAEARSLGYGPLLAEALLIHGWTIMNVDPREEALAPLAEATRVGLESGMDAVAMEALARRIYAESTSTGGEPGTPRDLEMGLALARRLPRGGFVEALMLNNAGTAELAREDGAAARGYFERALAVVEAEKPVTGQLELLNIWHNLAMVTADNGEGVLLLERALAQLERALGGEHPRALSVRYAYGAYHASPERARAILVDTCERYARYHPELVSSWGRCMHILGLVEVELDQSSAAMNTLEALVARLSETGRLRSVRDLAQAQLHRLRGEYEAAEAALVQIIASQVGDQPDAAWWQQRKAAEARLELAALALMRGRHEQAEAILPWVIAVFERITAFNHSARYRRSLERARLLLATALWPSGVARSGVVSEDDRRRARELIQGVERWYRDAGAGYERGLAELERWRRARGLGS